jgi:hydrogenase small subunit
MDEGRSQPVHIIWIEGGGCEGCTMSVLGATSPRLEELLSGRLSGRPLTLHHPLLAAASGAEFLAPLRAAAAGELAPFVLVVEGSVLDEGLAGGGSFTRLGAGDGDASVAAWLERLAAHAAVVIAIGTCATWGGIPAAEGGCTGAHGVEAHLGPGFLGGSGLPVVNVPGCAPSGDAFVETLSYVVLHLDGLVPLELDDQGRPRWLYRDEVPLRAAGAGPGTPDVGVTAACPVPAMGWINRLGGCATVGGACNGCTRPDFPDATLPLVAVTGR